MALFLCMYLFFKWFTLSQAAQQWQQHRASSIQLLKYIICMNFYQIGTLYRPIHWVQVYDSVSGRENGTGRGLIIKTNLKSFTPKYFSSCLWASQERKLPKCHLWWGGAVCAPSPQTCSYTCMSRGLIASMSPSRLGHTNGHSLYLHKHAHIQRMWIMHSHRQADISFKAEWGQFINEVFQWLADKGSVR